MSNKRDRFLREAYRRKVERLLTDLANRPHPQTEIDLARAIPILQYLEEKAARQQAKGS